MNSHVGKALCPPVMTVQYTTHGTTATVFRTNSALGIVVSSDLAGPSYFCSRNFACRIKNRIATAGQKQAPVRNRQAEVRTKAPAMSSSSAQKKTYLLVSAGCHRYRPRIVCRCTTGATNLDYCLSAFL